MLFLLSSKWVREVVFGRKKNKLVNYLDPFYHKVRNAVYYACTELFGI